MIHSFLESLCAASLLDTKSPMENVSGSVRKVSDMIANQNYTWPKDFSTVNNSLNESESDSESILLIFSVLADRVFFYKSVFEELFGEILILFRLKYIMD